MDKAEEANSPPTPEQRTPEELTQQRLARARLEAAQELYEALIQESHFLSVEIQKLLQRQEVFL